MRLEQWAIEWGVSYAALAALRASFGITTDAPPQKEGMTEAAIMARVRLEAAQKGIRLWRNNVGACMTDTGSHIRFGLANESKRMNSIIKSSDLVGGRPRMIMPEDVGTIFAQLIVREVKEENWVYTGTEEEQAQFAFLKLVSSIGGDAAFVNRVGTL